MLLIRNFTKNRLDKKFLEKVANKTLKAIKIRGKTEISLAIVGAKRIQKLNKKYRGVDKITDVLSFGELKDGTKAKFIKPPSGIKYLGEVIICFPEALRQAKRLKHSLKKELAVLLIHGILHLVGYDHRMKKEAEKMEIQEKLILKNLFL